MADSGRDKPAEKTGKRRKRDPRTEKIAIEKKKRRLGLRKKKEELEAEKGREGEEWPEDDDERFRDWVEEKSEFRKRIESYWRQLKPHLGKVREIVKTRGFFVLAVVFFAPILGFLLGQRFSIGYVIFTGAAASAVIYKIYYDLQKEMDEIRGERDRIKALEDRARAITENSLDCIFTLDLQGRITSFNRRAEQVTGYSKKDVLGNSLGMFLPPEWLKDFFEKLQKAVSTGVVPKYELELNTIYGRRNFELALTAIKNRDDVVGVQGIGRDITDRKRLEKELKIATSNLERWSKRTVKKEMTILEMKNQIEAIKRELETYGAGNN